MNAVRVLRHAARAGFADYSTIYTWKTWLAGWYLRILAQVAFFAFIGKLLGSEEQVRFLLIGSAVLLAATGSMFAVASTQWERWAGTLPLLVASPSSPVVVFAGRSAWAFTEGVVSALATFFVLAPAFGVDLPGARTLLVVPLVVLIALSAYGLGTFLGGIVLRRPSTRNVVANVTWTTMLSIAGVAVPLSFHPEPVRWLAHALPLTHGLQAVRELLAGDPLSGLLADAAAEAGIGIAWTCLALLTFSRFAEGGRRDGSISFGG